VYLMKFPSAFVCCRACEVLSMLLACAFSFANASCTRRAYQSLITQQVNFSLPN
ncbi:hypothetical protein CCACVL1_27060, partial [Corchorus capsularis]